MQNVIAVRRLWRGCASNVTETLVGAPSPTQNTQISCEELAVAHDQALVALPSELRGAYSLYSHFDVSLAEVAEALGLTLPAAKRLILGARFAIPSCLGSIWSQKEPRC
jgi:DNA-directed RNA polymerase specialized sigma24 family protein